MAASHREQIIRRAWVERGRDLWNFETHGRGLLPLNIPATVEMQPVIFGKPLPTYDNLEFRLLPSVDGEPTRIVCEGVVVDSIHNDSLQSLQISSDSEVSGVNQGWPDQSFGDAESVTEWLSGRPEEAACVFAARAALRVIPTINVSYGSPNRTRIGRETLLRVFRATSAAWALSAYPGQRALLNRYARSAASGLAGLQLLPPVRAAAYALATRYNNETSSDRRSDRATISVNYAIDAAGNAGAVALENMLQALSTDAQMLDQRFSPVTLAFSQLWPRQIPPWVEESWAELRFDLFNAEEGWEVWTRWYEERLRGHSADQDEEIARQTIDAAVWEQRNPGSINTFIAGVIDENERRFHEQDDARDDLPDISSIPQQIEAASQFSINAEGKIDLENDPLEFDAAQRGLYQEVRYKAQTLCELGHNQLAALSEAARRFLEAAPGHIEDVSVAVLWSRGNTLRTRLKAHDAVSDSGEPGDPALLMPLVAEAVRDLLHSYNVFIVGDPKGRELDQARLGPREREAAQSVTELASPIAEAVRDSGIATVAAIDALAEQIQAARQAPAGLNGDQAIDLSRKSSSNLVVSILRYAWLKVRSEPGFASREIRAGVYRQIGTAAFAAGPPSVVLFVMNYAAELKTFVEQAFHNPTLVRIIELIAQTPPGS